jgi:uncharacterized protein YbjQ (UPF0145 family)
MEALIKLGIFLVLLILGYIFGTRAEKKHYLSIYLREAQFRTVVITTERLPAIEFLKHDTVLVTGNVVISVDYFKVVIAGLRKLIGGRISSYESLFDRARREAILRLQAHAQELGSNSVINMKFETSRISGNAGQGIGSIEVLAYGTALVATESQ